MSEEYKIINGQKVPVIKAQAVETIKNKRTGVVYASKADFDNDVADPSTDTTVDDFQQDLSITVAELSLESKTK